MKYAWRNALLTGGQILIRLTLTMLLALVSYNFFYQQLSRMHPPLPAATDTAVTVDDPGGLMGTTIGHDIANIGWPAQTQVLVRIRANALAHANDSPLIHASDVVPTCAQNHDCLVRKHPDFFDEIQLNDEHLVVPKANALVVDLVLHSADVSVLYGADTSQRTPIIEQIEAGKLGAPTTDTTPVTFFSPHTRKWQVKVDSQTLTQQPQQAASAKQETATTAVEHLTRALRLQAAHGDINATSLTQNLQAFSRELGVGDAGAIARYHQQLQRASLALTLAAFILWWGVLSLMRHLIGVAISRHRHPLGSKARRVAAQRNIGKIHTDSILKLDQMQLDALVTPPDYQATACARTDKWVSEVTALSRREYEMDDYANRWGAGNEAMSHLLLTWELAKRVERGGRVLELDEAALRAPHTFDPSQHPTVDSLHSALEAASQLCKLLPGSRLHLETAMREANAILQSLPARPQSTAQVVQILKGWDLAALTLANVTVAIPASDVVIRRGRHTWSPGGPRMVRPQIKALQESALERCLTPQTGGETATSSLADADNPSHVPASGTSARRENSGRQGASNDDSEAVIRATSRQLRDYQKAVRPRQLWRLAVGPVTLLVCLAVALLGLYFSTVGVVQEASIDTLIGAARALLGAAFTLGLATFAGTSLVVGAWHWIRNWRARNRSLRQTITATVMGEDELTLEVEQLKSAFPSYAQALERRLRTFISSRDGLLQMCEDGSYEDLEGEEQLALLDLAQMVRVQAQSLWRTGDILRRRPGWVEAWNMELSAVANCIFDKLGPAGVSEIIALHREVESGHLDGAQGLTRLDEISQPLRLARLIRALPVESSGGRWSSPPLSEQRRFVCENRSLLTALTGFERPQPESGYVLSDFATRLLSLRGSGVKAGLSKAALIGLALLFPAMPLLGERDVPVVPPAQWDFADIDQQAQPLQVIILDPAHRLGEQSALRRELEQLRFPQPLTLVVSPPASLPPAHQTRAEVTSSAPANGATLAPVESAQCEAVALVTETDPHCYPRAPRSNAVLVTVGRDAVTITSGALMDLPGGEEASIQLTDGMDASTAVRKLLARSGDFRVR